MEKIKSMPELRILVTKAGLSLLKIDGNKDMANTIAPVVNTIFCQDI